jgi:hypothetical protein
MNFNKHSNLKGYHATFGASKSSWLRYTPEKMEETIRSQYRTGLGTEIHEFAASQITLGHKQTSIKNVKDNLETFIFRKYFNDDFDDISGYGKQLLKNIRYLPKEVFETVKTYINDGIGHKMTPELTLVYSDIFFGTADTISFRDNYLRIHDLKTGATPTHIEQLLIYAAFFCLEYCIKPGEIDIELRIYQNDEILYHKPEADEILPIMDKIIIDNKNLQKFIEQEV